MLFTTCWAIVGPIGNTIEGRVYLHKSDAEVSMTLLRDSENWKETTLTLEERTLVVALEGLDKKLSPADVSIVAVVDLNPKPCIHGKRGPCHDCVVDGFCGR